MTGTAGAAAFAMTILPLNLAGSAGAASSETVGYSNTDSVRSAVLQKELSGAAQGTLAKSPDDKTHYGCIDNTDVETFKMRDNCVIGDPQGATTMVVIGDSHAWQWGDAFNEIGQKLDAKVITMAKGGCSPEVYSIKNPELNREYSECDSWRESAFEQIKDLKPDVIVVTNRVRQEATEAGAEKAFQAFQDSGARIVYLTDTPQPGRNVPDCLATHTDDIPACNPTQDQAIEFPAFRAMEQKVAKRHGAEIIDTLPVFCADNVCPTVIGDQIVYFDSSHITAGYAKSLVPFLQPTFRKVLAADPVHLAPHPAGLKLPLGQQLVRRIGDFLQRQPVRPHHMHGTVPHPGVEHPPRPLHPRCPSPRTTTHPPWTAPGCDRRRRPAPRSRRPRPTSAAPRSQEPREQWKRPHASSRRRRSHAPRQGTWRRRPWQRRPTPSRARAHGYAAADRPHQADHRPDTHTAATERRTER